ncbi:MAG: amidohydrolase family protein [Dehalococcoidia bacterium]
MGGREQYGFPVLDCDGHITEPLVIWEEYLEKEYRDQAKEHFSIQNTPEGAIWIVEEFMGPRTGAAYGGPQTSIGGIVVRAGAYRPGRTVEEIGKTPTDGQMWGPEGGYMAPGGFDSSERIKDMDIEGIDKAVIIPTFFAMVPGVHDAKLAAALCRAYNDWAWDYCKPYPDRLYPLAMVPVQDIGLAAAEFDRVAKKGFTIAAARPNPMAGHQLHESYWFPLWEKLQDAQVPLVFHPFPSSELVGGNRYCAEMGIGALGETLSFTLDNIVTVSGLIFHGVLDRFPKMNLAFIESSCTWVTGILDRLDKRFYLMRWAWPNLKTLPSEVFQRQIFISFEAAERGAAAISPLIQDNLIWASDYPHHDSDPPSMAVEKMNKAGLAKDIQTKVMGQNASRLFHIPLN